LEHATFHEGLVEGCDPQKGGNKGRLGFGITSFACGMGALEGEECTNFSTQVLHRQHDHHEDQGKGESMEYRRSKSS
jgi:hypothetical protein